MKKIKAIISVVLASMMMVSLSACSSKDDKTQTSEPQAETTQTEEAQTTETQTTESVKISILNSKNDINQQLLDAVKEFNKTNPNITIDVISTDQSPVEKATALYAAGTPATLCMLDAGDIAKFKDKAADLSSEKWVSEIPQPDLIDGKTLAFPFAVEGYGFIYNKEVVDTALGTTFDPSTINTTTALEDLFKKLEAANVSPLIIGSMDWSLGNHFLALTYANQPDSDINTFISSLKDGSADIVDNTTYNGLMNTFDVMMKYNKAKDDPMAITYERSIVAVATGEAAITFNGNWSMMEIQKSNPDGEFGFIPIPVSDDASVKGNSSIAIGATKQIFIDKENSTEDQQAAAKKFLEWIVYDSVGQDFLVNKCNIVPGFKNITLEPANSLAKSIVEYNNSGKAIAFAGNYVPADHWSVLGASMQKYLVGKIDKATLAADVEAYWKNIE
jgi:raffinose/stachyose/melibiose transport system substrate-binding protein